MKTNSLSNAADLDLGPPPPRRKRGSALYLLLWLMLAAGALIYLSALIVAPNQLMAFFGSPKSVATEPNEMAEADPSSTAALEGEIAALKDQLEQVQGEVRTVVATNQSLTERLETIENASIQVQTSESSAVSVSQKKKTQAEPGDDGITGVVIGADDAGSENFAESEPAVPTKAEKKKAEERLAEEGAETGDQLADASAEPAPKAEKRKFGLELAVSTSPEALQLNWDLLNERHGEVLKGLSARAQPNPNDPSSYRLVTGPFTSAQQAQSVCAKLKKQNVTCQVTGFGGDNL